MGLLTFGFGPRQRLVSGGLGQRVQQTAHPSWFNTPVVDPDNYASDRMGQDGDPEYAVFTPDPDCVYNARALEIYLPQDVPLPPGSMDRILNQMRLMRPATCTIRVTESRGPERLLMPASRGEE
jgi:hypothetical protein